MNRQRLEVPARQHRVRSEFDDHVRAVWLELFEQFFRLVRLEVAVQQFFAALVDNTSIHFIGVKVDSALKWVLSLIKIYHGSLCGG